MAINRIEEVLKESKNRFNWKNINESVDEMVARQAGKRLTIYVYHRTILSGSKTLVKEIFMRSTLNATEAELKLLMVLGNIEPSDSYTIARIYVNSIQEINHLLDEINKIEAK